jgi:hypothetical protein
MAARRYLLGSSLVMLLVACDSEKLPLGQRAGEPDEGDSGAGAGGSTSGSGGGGASGTTATAAANQPSGEPREAAGNPPIVCRQPRSATAIDRPVAPETSV